jgi:hypothetical protein
LSGEVHQLWHHYGRSSRGNGIEGLDGKDDEKAEGDEGQDAANYDEGLVIAGWYRGAGIQGQCCGSGPGWWDISTMRNQRPYA